MTVETYRYPLNFFSNDLLENELFKAIVDNNIDRVKDVIKKEVNVNCVCNLSKPWTPVATAFKLNRHEIVNLLLEHGAILKKSQLKQFKEKTYETTV